MVFVTHSVIMAPAFKAGAMTRGFSVYCDLLRFSAAAMVFLAHLSWQRLSGGMFYWVHHYGHSAVIVFFVLSGYVIGYVAHEKERTLKQYAAARLSRLYSVVIPAILLTVAADAIGTSLDPAIYSPQDQSFPLVRMLLASAFLTQSWFGHWGLLSNGSYWSLPYEFWYYAMFGSVFYLQGRWRWIAALACALIAGPDILLYFPLWLFGLGAYLQSKTKLATPRLLFFATGAIGLAVFLRQGTLVNIHISQDYLPDGFRIEDYLLGLAVAGNLLAGSQLKLSFGRMENWIPRAAGMTFSLYLFHLPLLYLCAAILPVSWSPYLRGSIMLLAVPPVIWGLSQITEARKGTLRRAFLTLLDRAKGIQPVLDRQVPLAR